LFRWGKSRPKGIGSRGDVAANSDAHSAQAQRFNGCLGFGKRGLEVRPLAGDNT
jgi:hypothetical protein